MRENFERYFCTKTEHMLDLLYHELKAMGYELTANGKMFTYYPGKIPIMLVAHVDTVHQGPPADLVYCDKTQIAWSPTGLGADDRAGVWAIMEILRRGFRPHVLFTDGEERGLIGAGEAAKAFTPDNVHCLIELDRKGKKDCVFYSNDNRKFVGWVSNFGFKEDTGSCSDISDLMPAWDLSGVNLSIGYYRQHSNEEHLRVNEALATIDKVIRMLKKPPKGKVSYVKKEYQWQYGQLHGTRRERPNYYRQNEKGEWVPADEPLTLADYSRRVLPVHYHEKQEPSQNGVAAGASNGGSGFLAADWKCVFCRTWFSNKIQQEPSHGVCDDCVKAAKEVERQYNATP